MSVPAREVVEHTTGLDRASWFRIVSFLDPRSQLALMLTNYALHLLLIEKQTVDELLLLRGPDDQRSPREYYLEETEARYDTQRQQFPIAYALTRAALHEDFPLFQKKLLEFQNANGSKWADRLRERSAPGFPVVRIVMAQNNRQFFDYLYVTHQFPLTMKFDDGFTALSYALYYGAEDIAKWILKAESNESRLNDLRAAIDSPHENAELFELVLKSIPELLPDKVLRVLIWALEKKKNVFALSMVDFGKARGIELTKMLDSYAKDLRRFDLIYQFHCAMGTLESFRRYHPEACAVIEGNAPAEWSQSDPCNLGYGPYLRVAVLHSPREQALPITKNLLEMKRYNVDEEFREGRLLQSLLKQAEVPIPVLRELIDASADYYDKMPQDARSLYRGALLKQLLCRCEEAFSHDDTLKVARQMIRRWNIQLADFFKSKDSVNPALYGGRITARDLQRLRQYYLDVKEIVTALNCYNSKALRHFRVRDGMNKVFAAVAEDIVDRNVGVGFSLRGFERGMMEDIRKAVPPRNVRTYQFLSEHTELTSRNIMEHVLVRKQTIFKTDITWEFKLDPKGLAALHENPHWQTIDALLRWVLLYIEYETRKSESSKKCDALKKALKGLQHFPKYELSEKELSDPKQLLECLIANRGALRDAIKMHRYRDDKEHDPKGWNVLMECFPELAAYIRNYPDELKRNGRFYGPKTQEGHLRFKPLSSRPKNIRQSRDAEDVQGSESDVEKERKKSISEQTESLSFGRN